MIRREIMVFIIVGTLTVMIDFFTYRILLWTKVFDLDISKGAGFIVGMFFAYFANRRWTFGYKSKGRGVRSIMQFVLLYGVTLTVNVTVNALMLKVLGEMNGSFYLAFVTATGISAILNFIGMKLFVFRQRHIG